MVDKAYSYRDVLPPELDALWRKSRTEDEADEADLVLYGVGRVAVLATPTHVYRLAAGILPLGDGGERVTVRPLADLSEARVRDGLLVCRLGLAFATGEELQFVVRAIHRDKMRVAARILLTLSLDAQAQARERSLAERARAEAEAAAGRTAVAPGRLQIAPPVTPMVDGGTHAGPGVTAGADAVALLRGLWQLVEVGALSGEEFQAKKAELLGRV